MPPQIPDPLNPNRRRSPEPASGPAPAHTVAPVPVPAAPLQSPAPVQPVAPAVPAQPPAPVPPPSAASAHVDLSRIILPKKPGTPSVDSAQRVNAGVLFEQERTATLPEPEKPAAVPQQPQAPKTEQSLVRPLQTYQGDIESLVGEKQVSVVSIAAAEAQRRGMHDLSSDQSPLNQERRPWLKKTLIVMASILLLVAAGGTGYFIYARSQPVPLAKEAPAPFITVDGTETVKLSQNEQRPDIMNALVAAKKSVSLSLGLMERIQIAKPGALNDGSLQEVSAPEFLQAFAPSVPPQLVRTLEPQMLLGVHSYDENQAFMILKADSYETAYSGMLAWEESLYRDLMPLFDRKPPVHRIPGLQQDPGMPMPVPAPVLVGTSTASSSPEAAGTPIASSTAGTTTAPVQFFQGNFIDQIVENHDARVLLNQDGDILLLWTFLDRSTIVITTNEATLREVISRISQSTILSLPPGK